MHSHHHDHHHHYQRARNKKGLLFAICITAGIMILEFVGGLLTKSLALISDSIHMLSDVSSLLLSFVAMWIASRPPSPKKTYGYDRFEILAVLINGLMLFVIAAFIIWEAIERMFDPPVVIGHTMMLIAVIGLMANLISAFILMKMGDVKENVNLRSAYLHVLGDALGSVGAIIAGIFITWFSWYLLDPLISIIVALLILRSAWGVVNQAIHILMEGTPTTIDYNKVEEVLKRIPGVKNVHDLHIWTITSGLNSLSCHLLIENDFDSQAILKSAIHQIEKHFSIQHSTIQIETSDCQQLSNQIICNAKSH